MKSTLQRSQKVNVQVKEYEPQDILALVQDPVKLNEITICVNADRRQKVALVEFRRDLAEEIEKVGWKRPTELAKKGDTEVSVFMNTEGEDIEKFVQDIANGSFTPPDFTLTGDDDKAKEVSARSYLQKLATALGEYVLDIARPEPKAKSGKLPQWAVDGASKILGNKNHDAWREKFKNGFTSPEGIAIDPIAHESFHTDHHETNVKNLAAALVSYDKQKKAKSQNEFA